MMLWFPFRSELNETFRHDRSLWGKVAGGAFATTLAVLFGALHATRSGDIPLEFTPTLVSILTLGSAFLGAFLGLALSLKDTVQRRIEKKQRVSLLLRVYFGIGIWSLAAWFPTMLVAAFVVTMATLM
jgi:hypothetical protein